MMYYVYVCASSCWNGYVFFVMCDCWRVIIQYSTGINSVAMCVCFPFLFLMGTLELRTPAADLSSGDQAQSEEDSLLELTQVLHLASFGN